jgi:curved DNA-binding protein CbpA
LGVTEKASGQEIRQAYWRLAKRYHPDVSSGHEEKFSEITAAYNTLSDPILRRQYDMRRRQELLYAFAPYTQPNDDKSDRETTIEQRRSRYADSVWEWASIKRSRREQFDMKIRRKILIAMSVSFVLFLSAAIWFDNWLHEERQNQTIRLSQEEQQKQHEADANSESESLAFMASPFDSIFGKPVYEELSLNALTIFSLDEESIICLTEANPPCRTIRNVYVPANLKFVFRGLPDGDYCIKVYTGKQWKMSLFINGRKTGRYTANEQFLLRDGSPIRLRKPTVQQPNSNYTDTVNLQSSSANWRRLSPTSFFTEESQLPLHKQTIEPK